MSIYLTKPMNFKTDNENVSVIKNGVDGCTTLQLMRVKSDGEKEEV